MKTRKQYIEYLNEIGASLSDDEFIIGGKKRNRSSGYGNLIKKYDPIAFQVGFKEWIRQ